MLKVTPDIKILGLYLMDSITKNLKSNTNYVELFQKNLINVFTHVFSNVSVRSCMHSVNMLTWLAAVANRTVSVYAACLSSRGVQ